MKVLITGGAGFIGLHLARRLVAQGHTVTALDLLHPQVHLDPDAAITAFPGVVTVGDVADADTWSVLATPDAVVHLAAETGTGQSMYEQDRYHRVNVDGTALAGSWAARWGAPVVALGSRAVYGEGRHACPRHGTTFGTACCVRAQPEASAETDEHRPVSVYGETKSLGEDELAAAVVSVPVTVVRPQNVVGPGQALHNPYTGVLAAFLAMLREARPITVYGDGSQTRDFVHVDDLARLVAWCVEHPGAAGEVGPSTAAPASAPPCWTWPGSPPPVVLTRPTVECPTRSRSCTSRCTGPATSTTPAPTSPGCASRVPHCRSGAPPTPSRTSSGSPGTDPARSRRPGTTLSTRLADRGLTS